MVDSRWELGDGGALPADYQIESNFAAKERKELKEKLFYLPVCVLAFLASWR